MVFNNLPVIIIYFKISSLTNNAVIFFFFLMRQVLPSFQIIFLGKSPWNWIKMPKAIFRLFIHMAKWLYACIVVWIYWLLRVCKNDFAKTVCHYCFNLNFWWQFYNCLVVWEVKKKKKDTFKSDSESMSYGGFRTTSNALVVQGHVLVTAKLHFFNRSPSSDNSSFRNRQKHFC